MIRVSCSSKLHAFNLAEQLERHHLLDRLYTVYHQKKNALLSRFNGRQDNEVIGLDKVRTFSLLAPLVKVGKNPFLVNSIFDRWVAYSLKRDDYKVFIGWSGMSLKAMTQAKRDGKKTVVERGSSHIGFQIPLLEDEYSRWGFRFERDNRVIDQELLEYDLADYISIPSEFVKQSFIDKGIDPKKLIKNNYGSSAYFKPTQPKRSKFTILYLGKLSLQKGLPYLFQALNDIKLDRSTYEVWFIGSVDREIQQLLPRYNGENWKFFGHVNHYQLADYISQCSVAVHPSLQEGLSMVIPQIMSCGVPVIATTNTGGFDLIQDGRSGFIIPIRSPEAIAEKLLTLFTNHQLLEEMQSSAADYARQLGSWSNYGDRYADFLRTIIN